MLEQLQLAFALASCGRPDESLPLFERSLRGARRIDRDFTVLSCLTGLTAANGASGNLVATRRWADEAIAHATPRGLARSPNLVLPYACAAEAAYEHCDLDRAGHLVNCALAIIGPAEVGDAETTSDRGAELDAVPVVVRSLQSVATCVEFSGVDADPAGQREIVTRRLDQLRRLPAAPFAATLVGFELLTLHRMALVTAQLAVAEEVERMAAAIPALAGDALALRGLRAVRLGHDREARIHVSPLVRGQLDCLLVSSAITAQLVEVTVAQRNQQATVAHEALLLALTMTATHDGLKMMLDVSTEVVTALQAGRGRFGRHEPLAHRVIETAEAHDADPARRRSHQSASSGAAPLLSPRELSLLSELPSLLTVAEIAAARSVSPNTVKSQLRSLFVKLGVSTRRDAVAAGRHEGLI